MPWLLFRKAFSSRTFESHVCTTFKMRSQFLTVLTINYSSLKIGSLDPNHFSCWSRLGSWNTASGSVDSNYGLGNMEKEQKQMKTGDEKSRMPQKPSPFPITGWGPHFGERAKILPLPGNLVVCRQHETLDLCLKSGHVLKFPDTQQVTRPCNDRAHPQLAQMLLGAGGLLNYIFPQWKTRPGVHWAAAVPYFCN